MARNAVILSVILSLFLLSRSHARLHRDLDAPEWAPREVSSNTEREPKEVAAETVSMSLRPFHLTAIRDAERSRMIAHSFRLPIVNGASSPHRHGHVSLRPKVELSYGNDMVPGLAKIIKKKECDDSSESAEKMMKKRLRRMMKRKNLKVKRDDHQEHHHGDFMAWLSGFLNHF